MRIVPLFPALLLAMSTGSRALQAQLPTPGGPDAVLVAAARHLRAQAPAARIAFDPRALNGGTLPAAGIFLEARSPERTQRLAAPLGAQVREVERLTECGSDSTRHQCRLSGVDLVIGMGEPAVSGTTATVAVSSWRQWSTLRGPRVSTVDEVLTLQLTAQGWQVTKAERKRTT